MPTLSLEKKEITLGNLYLPNVDPNKTVEGGNLFKIGLNNFKGGGVGFGGRGGGGGDRVCCGCGVHFVRYAFFTIKNALLLNYLMPFT